MISSACFMMKNWFGETRGSAIEGSLDPSFTKLVCEDEIARQWVEALSSSATTNAVESQGL